MMRKLLYTVLINIIIFTNTGFTQGVSINTTGNVPDSSSILDVSSTTKGVLIPRMTTTERNSITNPADGLMIFNTQTTCFEFCYTGIWYSMNCTCEMPTQPVADNGTDGAPTQFIAHWFVAANATGYYLDVATDSSFTNFVSGYFNKDVGITTSYVVSGLNPSTAYYYRVRAYSDCGTTANSNTIIYATTAPFTCNSSFIDGRDGKTYNTVLIGAQCWMKQSVNYGTYVPYSVGAQNPAGTQKYCWGDDTAKCTIYGGMYEWAEIMDGSSTCNGTGAGQPHCTTPVQGICPVGWHLPSYYEWNQLELYICTSGTCATDFPYDYGTFGWRGTDEGTKLKIGGSSGFDGLAGGYYSPGFGFQGLGDHYQFWSCTQGDASNAYYHYMFISMGGVCRSNASKTMARYVRCIKD